MNECCSNWRIFFFFFLILGIFNTASKISGSLGKGLATLAMDENYLREREMRSRHKPKYIGEGIALGIRDLGVDVYHGVTGVFVSQYLEHKKKI